MTIHWKAVEQYFTVVLFVNPLTPRVKPWAIQSFLTFDSMDRTLNCDHSLEICWAVLYCGVFVVVQFYPVCKFWKITFSTLLKETKASLARRRSLCIEVIVAVSLLSLSMRCNNKLILELPPVKLIPFESASSPLTMT